MSGAERLAGAARRNLTLLAASQGLLLCAMSITITVGALAGAMLAPDPTLATLPYALISVVAALTIVPASLLMGRLGRAGGFTLGAAAGAAGAAVAVLAIWRQDFWLFCLGMAGLGLYQAFGQYYRYAAAEAVPPSRRPQAISWVVAGGLLAAFLGPRLGAWGRDMMAPALFAGSFVIVTGLGLAAMLTAAALRVPPPEPAAAGERGRPLGRIVRRPGFVVGTLSAMVGFAVMSFVMTATPLAMIGCGFGVGDAAQVIQWHLVGMFAPSLVTGQIIARFGLVRVILAGIVLLLASASIALSGITLTHFTAGLVLLGIGWNFMYVGGTALIAASHEPAERARVQATGELLIFGTVAIATLASGGVLDAAGWNAVNAIVLPLLLAAGAAVGWLAVAGRARPADHPV